MVYDYVFANLQVAITLKADNDSQFGQLTDREVLTLQQLFYMTLMEFSYTKALYTMDVAALNNILDAIKKIDKIKLTGG